MVERNEGPSSIKMVLDLNTGFGKEPVILLDGCWFAETIDGLHFRRYETVLDRQLLENNEAGNLEHGFRLQDG